MNPLNLTRWTVRIAGLAALVLGLLIWAGVARALVPIHTLIGITLVVGLWTEAVVVLRAGGKGLLPGVALAWGLLTVGFGLTQAQVIVGGSHVIVEVAHLLVGIVAIGLGEALAATARSGRMAAA